MLGTSPSMTVWGGGPLRKPASRRAASASRLIFERGGDAVAPQVRPQPEAGARQRAAGDRQAQTELARQRAHDQGAERRAAAEDHAVEAHHAAAPRAVD